MCWIPEISTACISYRSCQQTRPISSSRIFQISTKLSVHCHIYLLSSLIISVYILTTLLLCYMFSNGHVTLPKHFLVTSQCIFIKSLKYICKKHLNFYFKKRNHFRDELTRPVTNTRLFTTLKSVAIIKPDMPINIYTRFCLNTAKSKFSLVSPVADWWNNKTSNWIEWFINENICQKMLWKN